MTLTPAQRVLRARMGGCTTASRHDGAEMSAPARAGFLARFEREVDPEGALAPEERTRRALAARKAYMAGLRLRRSTPTKGGKRGHATKSKSA